MKKNVGVPVIVAAVVGLIVILVILGKSFMKGPDTVATAPPPWIDAATGKPKAQMSGSGTTSTPKAPGSPTSAAGQ